MACALRLLFRPAFSLLCVLSLVARGQTPQLARQPLGIQGLSAPGRIWSTTGPYWEPVEASIGNFGTQVFVGTKHNLPVGPNAFLLSSHDADPAAPCWESLEVGEETYGCASAAWTDVHVVITNEGTQDPNQRIRHVRKYSSHGLDWQYTYPQLGAGRNALGISRDGSVIMAAIGNPTTGLNDVLVFGPGSPLPVHTYAVPTGVIWGFDLAAQGTHALFALGSTYYVLDLSDGSLHLVYDHSPYALSAMGSAISGDGSVVGCSTSVGIGLFEWNGSDYVQTWSHAFGFGLCADISDDSSTMAYGTGGGYGSPHIVTECVDIPSKTITMSEDLTGTGQFGNRVEDIAISANGERFVSATCGDEFDLVPEVRVYAQHESTPIRTLNLPGSALCVDISPDGQWIAAGSIPLHVELPSMGGRVDLFHMGRSDFLMHTTPALGHTVTFEVFGVTGRRAYLLDSPIRADPPLLFPGWGALHLDPATMQLTPMGTIGASGSQTLGVTLSTDPLLIGTSHYYQGFTDDPLRRLTRDWLVVTILP